MILECPHCSTRFHLDEKALGSRRPTLRCSNCTRTFTLPPRRDPDEDELSFTYDDGPDPDNSDPPVTETGNRGEQFDFLVNSDRQDDPQPSLFEEDENDYGSDDDDYSIGTPPPDYSHDGFDDEEIGSDDVTNTSQIKPLLFFLVLVVAGYGMLAWTLRTEPDWARSLMKQVPILGTEIRANRLGREIVLDDLRGRYERTKEGKVVFLVTGNARNEHDQSVSGIRVELQLRNEGGSTVARQLTTCGNAMRADLVRDLTQEQVQILRGWGTRPPQEATVTPGASCPIVGIFIDVPDDVAEFSGQVTQARRVS